MTQTEEGLADYALEREESDARELLVHWASVVCGLGEDDEEVGWSSHAQAQLRAAHRRALEAGVLGESMLFDPHPPRVVKNKSMLFDPHPPRVVKNKSMLLIHSTGSGGPGGTSSTDDTYYPLPLTRGPGMWHRLGARAGPRRDTDLPRVIAGDPAPAPSAGGTYERRKPPASSRPGAVSYSMLRT